MLLPGRKRGPCLFGEKSRSDKVPAKRQRCDINNRDHNKLQNIVLIALAAVLVVAVAVAVGMAGRIRKQEQAGQSASEAISAETATEAPAPGASEPGASEEGDDPEGPGEPKTDLTEATPDGGSPEEISETGSGGAESPAGNDAAPASTDDGSAEDAGGTGRADTGSGTAAPFVKTVHVEVDGVTVLETPLTGESKYAIIDGRAVELEVETTLTDMQGLADPANHDVNLIYIHDGRVACSESNCENQVCVHTGELTGSAFDLPIICLPHGVVVQVID